MATECDVSYFPELQFKSDCRQVQHSALMNYNNHVLKIVSITIETDEANATEKDGTVWWTLP